MRKQRTLMNLSQLGWAIGFLLTTAGPLWAWRGSVQDAFSQSARMGRPLLVLATRTTCMPCQAMKRRLHETPTLAAVREHFIIVPLDITTPDFQTFHRRYPTSFEMVPMVYVVSPPGELLYARPGALDVDQLIALHDATLQLTGTPLTEAQISQNELRLESVREAAAAAKLTSALRLIAPICEQQSSAASTLVAARYQTQIEQAIVEYSDELSRRLETGTNIHESGYLLARLYVHVPTRYEDLRGHILSRIRQHESHSKTRTAMEQGKRLVRAKIEERRRQPQAALLTYRHLIGLDPTTPAAEYARRRAESLQAQQAKGDALSQIKNADITADFL